MDLEQLNYHGWAKIQFEDSSEATLRREMRSLASQLGEPIPTRSGDEIFAVLTPLTSENARPNSLSRKFARGEFELHNDTAHWPTPCRHILLGCVDPGQGKRPTFLVDTKRLALKSSDRDLLHAAPIRVTNGRNSFYSTILNGKRPFVRYDLGCMSGPTDISKTALQVLRKQNWPNEVEEFCWQPGVGLLIDNWRVLHGRGAAIADDAGRRLLRISFL